MKATGIVRRIDELGRVVIPKEIRRTMKIREGDPLEIFTDREGELIFKKYSPTKEISAFADRVADALSESIGLPVIITDKDVIVAASGISKKEYIDLPISEKLERCIDTRKAVVNKQKDTIPIKSEDSTAYTAQAIAPILAGGDLYGSVTILSKELNASFSENELKLAKVTAGILGTQLF
ncbi:MAG: AbrB/MazE/SpoVT family DNA-binding domain-containing protein [Clostridiales bacterium]|jgi:AbrB family transcriptional regulator (stage V sporulation protein T)|nr:AbrB/MazE/SpoVT family DNA-binding domain-containing protein [Clostridiales bacterium]